MHTNIGVTLKPTFYEFLVVECFLIYAFSSCTLTISNLQNRMPKIFAFYIFGLNCSLYPHIRC